MSFLDLEGTDPVSAAREGADAITAARKDVEQRGVKAFLFASASAEEFDQRAEFSEVPDILDEVADKYLGSPDQRAKLTATLRREFVATNPVRRCNVCGDVWSDSPEWAEAHRHPRFQKDPMFQVMGPNVRTYVHPNAGCSADGQEQVVDADQTALGAGPVCPHCQVRFSVKPEKTASDPCGGCPAGTKCVCTHDGCRCVKTSAKTANGDINEDRFNRFSDVYRNELEKAVKNYPEEYVWPVEQVPVVHGKMMDAVRNGSYNKDSRAIKSTVKALGVKHTYSGIRDWLTSSDDQSTTDRTSARGKYEYAHPDSEMNSKLHYTEDHSAAAADDTLSDYAPLKSWRAVHRSDHESRPNDLDHVHHDGPGYMPPGTEHEYSPGARSGSVKTAWNGRCDFCGDDFDDRDSDNYGEEEKECVMPGCGNRSVHEGHGIEVALDPEFPQSTDFICDSHWNYGGKAKGFNEGGKGVSLTPDARRVLGLSPLRPSRKKAQAEDDDGDYDHRPVEPKGYAVCPTCRGKGTHVNPSIDAHGLTAEDFDEDPDFAEDYMRGAYDVPCAECGGKRVVPQCSHEGCTEPAENEIQSAYSGDHRDRATKNHWNTCYQHASPEAKAERDDYYQGIAENEAELRMGA